MPTLHHLYKHIQKYGRVHRSLYFLCFLTLFWTLFDGILSFIFPVLITEEGFSKTTMGIILGSSSIAGLFFDFVLCRVLTNTNFRRLYFFMFILCFVYPLILWQAKSVWLYLIAMALWGLYYDLHNFGDFNFVGKHTQEEEHSSSFGVINVFNSLGYILAPLFAGILIAESINFRPFLLALIFLSIAFIFFLVLIFSLKKEKGKISEIRKKKPINILQEWRLWKTVGISILPVLCLTFMLNIIDSFFWTVGPLLSEGLSGLDGLGGLFITGYLLPHLFVGWFVGPVTKKIGKKKTAFFGLLSGSFLFSLFFFIQTPTLILLVNFLASFCISFAFPAVSGAYADYISESGSIEKEIEGVTDSAINLGYVVGPITAGFLADQFGNAQTFSILGIAGMLIALILLRVTPKKITIPVGLKSI